MDHKYTTHWSQPLAQVEKKIFEIWPHFDLLCPAPQPPGVPAPSHEQIKIPMSQGTFVPNMNKIGPVVLEKKMKMCKLLTDDSRRTSDLGDLKIHKIM